MSNPKLLALIGGIGLGVAVLYRWFGSGSAESSPPPPEPPPAATVPNVPAAPTPKSYRQPQQYYRYRFGK